MGNEYDKRRSAAAAAAAHSAVPSSYQRPYHYGQPQQQQQQQHQLAEQQVPPPPPSNMAAAQHQQHWYGYHQHPAQQTQVGGWVSLSLSLSVSFSFTPLYWILGKAGHSLFHAKESELLQKILFYSVLVSLLCVVDFESCNGSLVLWFFCTERELQNLERVCVWSRSYYYGSLRYPPSTLFSLSIPLPNQTFSICWRLLCLFGQWFLGQYTHPLLQITCNNSSVLKMENMLNLKRVGGTSEAEFCHAFSLVNWQAWESISWWLYEIAGCTTGCKMPHISAAFELIK